MTISRTGDYDFDVLVVGGGPAGLSAAMALGRLRRTVLVCDDGRPRNAASSHIHNLVGQEGMHPATWRANARKDLAQYPSIQLRDERVAAIEKVDGGFLGRFASGDAYRFRKLLLAHGVENLFPAIEGLRELWGKSVFHCPFCHGFEHQDQRIAVIGNHAMVLNAVILLSGLTAGLTVFSNGPAPFESGEREMLARNGMALIETPVRKLLSEAGTLSGIGLANGEVVSADAALVFPMLPLREKAPFGDFFGCEKTELGTLKLDERGRTTVHGVYGAGDLATKGHSVLFAAASGGVAGAGIAFDLLNEDLAVGGIRSSRLGSWGGLSEARTRSESSNP